MAQELVLEHAYIDERGRQFKGFVMGDEMLMSKSSRIITSKIQPKIIINPPLKSVREHRVIKNDFSTITYNSRNPYEKQIQGKSLTHRYKETTSKSGKSIIVPIHKPTELSNVSSSKSTLTEQMIPKSNKVYKNIVYAINGNPWQRINDKGKLSGLKSIYSMTASPQFGTSLSKENKVMLEKRQKAFEKSLTEKQKAFGKSLSKTKLGWEETEWGEGAVGEEAVGEL